MMECCARRRAMRSICGFSRSSGYFVPLRASAGEWPKRGGHFAGLRGFGAPLRERDLAVAQELAARSVLAIENARLYRQSRESAEWLSTTLRSIGDAVAVADDKGAVKFLNPVAETLTGWLAAEAIGRPIREVFRIVCEMTGEPVESPVDKALATGKVVGLTNHTELLGKDGRRVSIDDSAAPIFDLDGKISGVVLVFRDVSAQRQVERDRAERAALATFSAAVHRALAEADSMAAMLARCTELVVEYLDAAFARIWLLDAPEKVPCCAPAQGSTRTSTARTAASQLGLSKLG